MNLGDRIKQCRTNKNLTQKELAAMIGVAEITIRQYETGKRQPRIETIEKIADILDVTIQYLIGFESNDRLNEDYQIKKGAFIDYLYSLGFSVETPLELKEHSSQHFIGYENRSKFKVVDAKLFKNFQDESNNYVIYLMNNLLERSIDLDDYIYDDELPDDQ
ncbi:MAG: helix-turn-helix transcriptional regulator [Anaerocolumna aminovalerica]|uniref:helix-turn-helix domain-containing protein n=1 Tax=Anaerocolumna aminovalerica TaxID=1527 RepID=UPI0029125817|nr:helix-turn-helix transcriptional regulator [Anaerocolumna aminovalerica]MDU6265823.1 helix-turn-helix transcriptional regulator [Anaerocolumna aminovalerica]